MKRGATRPFRVLLTFVLLILVVLPVWQTYRRLRQQRLDHALITAIKMNNTAEAISLLAEGANANTQDTPPDTRPLWLQFWDSLPGKHRPLASGPSALLVAMDVRPDTGEYPQEDVALVGALLRANANVNVANDSGYTPLMMAATCVEPRTLRLLLDHGANPNAKDVTGDKDIPVDSALTLAVMAGDIEEVTLLLKSPRLRPASVIEALKATETYANPGTNPARHLLIAYSHKIGRFHSKAMGSKALSNHPGKAPPDVDRIRNVAVQGPTTTQVRP